jgi:hypothetical protein
MARPPSHGGRVIGTPITDNNDLEQLGIYFLEESTEAPADHCGLVVRRDHDRADHTAPAIAGTESRKALQPKPGIA